LWVENNPDDSSLGTSRAIPAEYVNAVFEVKATWNPGSASKAIKHLEELAPLLKEIDQPTEPYKKFLPPNFLSAIVFYDLERKWEYSRAALDHLVPQSYMRGYLGGLVLRGEGLPAEITGEVFILIGDTPRESSVGIKQQSLLTGLGLSQTVSFPDNKYLGAMLMWGEVFFSKFAFDLLAIMAGNYRRGYLSSLHGMSWLDPDRDKTDGKT
jgi:hypothetical protein